MSGSYFATPAGSDEAIPVAVDGDEVRLEAASGAGDARLAAGPGPGRVLVRHEGRSAVAFVRRSEGAWEIEVAGRSYAIRVDDERMHRLRELTEEMAPAGGARELRAPMPGLVVRVAVSRGDRVGQGDGLVVMEAMKMENELRAEHGGVVADVHVSEGATVDRDELLVTFEVENA